MGYWYGAEQRIDCPGGLDVTGGMVWVWYRYSRAIRCHSRTCYCGGELELHETKVEQGSTLLMDLYTLEIDS